MFPRGKNGRLVSALPDIPRRTMTAEVARRLWAYEEKTGLLRWLVSPHPRVRIGDIAGSLSDGGYLALKFKGRAYRVARVAWLIKTGKWPTNEVDHRNGVRSDDRWDNLREATRGQQTANTKMRSDNKLRVRGVHQRKYGSFVASICHSGRRIHLGSFGALSEAKAAYDAAAARLFGEFYRDVIESPTTAFIPDDWGWPIQIGA